MMIADSLTHDSPADALRNLSKTTKASGLRHAHRFLDSISDQISKVATQQQLSSPENRSLDSVRVHVHKSFEKIRTRSNEYIKTVSAAQSVSESILAAIGKVAVGGSQTSAELRDLELHRRATDLEAEDIEVALSLRQLASAATEAIETMRYVDAAKAVQDFRMMDPSERALSLVGAQTIRAYQKICEILQRHVLEQYEAAVVEENLASLSELTPVLSMLLLADRGVEMYLRFIRAWLAKCFMGEPSDTKQNQSDSALRSKLANIYNSAVTTLRHHLPMVAYALGEADGDAALVRLIHTEVERNVLPLITAYVDSKKLAKIQESANKFVNDVEDRFMSGNDVEEERISRDVEDCGFRQALGSLSDVDSFAEEIALILQYTESYERFLNHAVGEIKKAKVLRENQLKDERRRRHIVAIEREGKEFTSEEAKKQNVEDEIQSKKSAAAEIIPRNSQLNEVITELAGYYSAIERALLLASMQRTFTSATYYDDKDFYSASKFDSEESSLRSGRRALQTALVEESFYAVQRSTLRAFATGQTQAAAVAANLCSDTLSRILLEVLLRRCEFSISALKPGDGLLSGQGGIGLTAMTVVSHAAQKGLSKTTASVSEEKAAAKQRIENGIARSCASFNDFEIAAEYVRKLESKLILEIDTSYPHGKHTTEQLSLCVKSMSSAADSFRNACNQCVEQLISILTPKLRSICTEAVGHESTTATSFTTVMTVGVSAQNALRMNYDLDDNAYQMSQISEGFIGKLCTALDDFILHIRIYLFPRIADAILIGILGVVCKRLESAVKRCIFTPLGALSFDSDVRLLINFFRDRLASPELNSNTAVYKACNAASRMAQLSLLMNVDDVDDVLDLITTAKRKGAWDLSFNDTKAFLSLRSDFESRKVHELLQNFSDD